MPYNQPKPRETVTAVIDKIWDDVSTARNMELMGFGRMGAPYKKILQQVTEGGTLAEGQEVTVEYTVNGQYKNAEKITINQAAAATQAATAAANADPMEKGGKHNRVKPNDFRHPDEITRIEVLRIAADLVVASGELQSGARVEDVLPEVTDLAELLQAFVEDQVDAVWIKENVGAGTKSAPSSASQPAQETNTPSPEAQAASQASAKPGPAEGGGDAMSRWMAGE